MYDLIIKNANIIDGSGESSYKSDIAIIGEKIVKIDENINDEAKKIINAENKNVVPGFIDMHCHDEVEILKTNTVAPKIKQGVTTVVNGNCGIGFIPVNPEKKSDLYDFASKLFNLEDIEISWNNYETFKKQFTENNLGINIVNLIPHGALRISVMGFKEKTADENEKKEMGLILEEYLKDGAYGMSTGLLYPPCSYANLEELTYLCNILAKHDKIFTIHLRNESDEIIKSIKDVIEIAKKTGVSVEVSHLNISGKDNWGKSKEVLTLIEKARDEGYNINCDQYPYKAGSTFISALLPQWSLDGGTSSLIEKLKSNKDNIKIRIKDEIENGIDGWDNIIKSSGWGNIVINSVKSKAKKDIVGKSLLEISKLWAIDKYEVLYKLIVEERGEVTVLIFSVDEEDLYRIFKKEYIMVGTDGIKLDGKPHPRLFGTYFKILDKFIKEKNLLSLEKTIRKMTSLPAEKLKLKDRGLIKENYFADLVILDFEKIKDLATYEEPELTGEGIKYVILNGNIVVNDKNVVSKTNGKFL
ncbi:MAG: D-aminoacylase [Halanaerobiales bacterium]|nr:D-aminoacylase [Halanaerobiales bacterium]